MKTLVRIAVCGLPALFLVGARGAQAQITKSGGGYLFRVKYHKGEKLRYTVTSETTPPNAGKPIVTTMPMTMTVADVHGNVATVDMSVGPVTMNGRQLMPIQNRQVKMDERSRVVGGGIPGMEQMTAALPEKPLAVGQSFSSTARVSQMGQNIDVKSTMTFKGIKTVGGKPVAQMAVTSTGAGTMSIKGVGTALFSVADGSLVSMNVNQQMLLQQGQNKMTLKSTTHIQRK